MPSISDQPQCRVIFLDSGVGGLPYLFHFHEANPRLPLLYIADTANFPYGTKTEDEIRNMLLRLCERHVIPRSPAVLVVACNTASVVALDFLRASFPSIPIVGTVPAIKPAAEISRTRTIGVLATERTIEDPYIDELARKHAADCRIVKQAANELVLLIEDGRHHDTAAIRTVLSRAVAVFNEAGVDQVVLGCTHFIHAASEIADLFGGKTGVVDSRLGITRRIEYLLTEIGLEHLAEHGGDRVPKLLLTGTDNPGKIYQEFIDDGSIELEDDIR